MLDSRNLLSRTCLLLLASLPLTACSAESLNAVRGLLNEASATGQTSGQNGGQKPGQTAGQPSSQTAGQPSSQTAGQPSSQNAAQPSGQNAGQPGRPGISLGAGGQAEGPFQGQNLPGQTPPVQTHPGQTVPDKHECFCERVLIRVRWGQFVANPAVPVWTPWRGRLKSENAQLRMLNTIRYESGDQILPNPPDAIGWMAHTKPHFDGFAAVMRFDHDLPAPKLILNTNYGNKVFTLPELRNIDFTRQVDPLGNRFQIKTYALPRVAGHCSDDMPLPEHPDFRFPDEDLNVNEPQETMPTPGPEPELAPEAQAL